MGRLTLISSNIITRPADTTPYAAGDIVANSTSAGSVTPFLFSDVVRSLGYQCLLRRVKIQSGGGTVVTNGSFRVAFFNAAPVFAAGDNAAHSFAVAEQAKFIGELPTALQLTSATGPAGWTVHANGPVGFKSVNSRNLWAALIAAAAYTPASAETFQLVLEVERS